MNAVVDVVDLHRLQTEYVYCEYCGKKMALRGTKDVTYDRRTGKKNVTVTGFVWACPEFKEDTVESEEHDAEVVCLESEHS